MSFLVKVGQTRSNYVNALSKCCIFAIANKKLQWRVKAAVQHSSSELGSTFTLHFTCICQFLHFLLFKFFNFKLCQYL